MKLQSKARSENEIEFTLIGSSSRLFASKTMIIVKPTGLAANKQYAIDKLWEYIQSRSDLPRYMNASLTYNKIVCVQQCFKDIENGQSMKDSINACYYTAAKLDHPFLESDRPDGALGRVLYDLRRGYDKDFEKEQLAKDPSDGLIWGKIDFDFTLA